MGFPGALSTHPCHPCPQGFFRIIKNQGGGASPPNPLPLSPDQSDHRGKKRNLHLGNSGQAIFGTPSFGSKTPSPPPPPAQKKPCRAPRASPSRGQAMDACRACGRKRSRLHSVAVFAPSAQAQAARHLALPTDAQLCSRCRRCTQPPPTFAAKFAAASAVTTAVAKRFWLLLTNSRRLSCHSSLCCRSSGGGSSS